jgi:mono/diheme cytochrome c family protein
MDLEKKTALGLFLTLVIVVFIAAYWATEPGRQAAAAERIQEEAMARGAHEYSQVCASCHGARGEGLVGPALRDTALDEDTLEKVISRGIPGTVMPAWSQEDGGPLKEHQVRDVVLFIKNWDDSLLGGGPTPTPTPTHTASPTPTPSPTTTAGDGVAQGRALFSSVGCAICHGPDGGGTAAGPSLRGVSRERVFQQVRSPEGIMPPFSPQVVSDEELELIIQFLESLGGQ